MFTVALRTGCSSCVQTRFDVVPPEPDRTGIVTRTRTAIPGAKDMHCGAIGPMILRPTAIAQFWPGARVSKTAQNSSWTVFTTQIVFG